MMGTPPILIETWDSWDFFFLAVDNFIRSEIMMIAIIFLIMRPVQVSNAFSTDNKSQLPMMRFITSIIATHVTYRVTVLQKHQCSAGVVLIRGLTTTISMIWLCLVWIEFRLSSTGAELCPRHKQNCYQLITYYINLGINWYKALIYWCLTIL